MSDIDDAIKQLERRGTLRASSSPNEDAQKQRKQLDSLLIRAEQSGFRQKFLCHYDATLRLVDLILLQHGYLLDEQPHATARKIISAIDSSIDFYQLSQVRHGAKKAGVTPSERDLNELLAVQQTLNNYLNLGT